VVNIGLGARLSTCLLALCLLVPTLGIRWQDAAALERFHSHALSPWPVAAEFQADPVEYFRRARVWLRERAFPIEAATLLQKNLAFFVLQSPPEERITLGLDGHIFLNSGDNRYLNSMLELTCVQAHTDQAAQAVQASLYAWGLAAEQRSQTIDLVMIPTAASLYGDKLPPSTPEAQRRACQERTLGRSALLSVRSSSPRVHFSYPLLPMLAARGDVGFFPRANWHALGLSLKVARDAYLRDVAPGSGAVDETLTLGEAPSELLMTYGIRKNEPTYFIHNLHVQADEARDARLRGAVRHLFIGGDAFVTHVFNNSKPVIDEAVLMVSDSYGDGAAEVFAGAFRSLIQVNINTLVSGVGPLLERVSELEQFERVILLLQEGNALNLAHWTAPQLALQRGG